MPLFDDGNAHGETRLAMNDSPPLRYCVCNDGKTYLRVADLWSAMFPGEKISQEAIDLLISRDSNHDLGMLLRKKEKFPGCGPEEDVVSFAGAHVWLWTLASHERRSVCALLEIVHDCLFCPSEYAGFLLM